MSGDNKKIAFSFSKVKKPALTIKPNIEPKEKVEYVDCFDGAKGTFSYKGDIKNVETGKKELVIPLISNKTSLDILKSRLEEKKDNKEQSKQLENSNNEGLKSSADTEQNSNLEELAVKEILKDIKNEKDEGKDTSKIIVDINTAEASEADIDYNNIPVSDFGLAMLRGMGWTPNSGIGKYPKKVLTVSPKVRPKGLGLGAKPISETNDDQKTEEAESNTKTESKSKHKHKHKTK